MNKRIMVFAPHPDDETLGCGGTIAKKISEGCEVFIVVMTDGRHAFSRVLGIYSDPTPEELRNIRRKELVTAAETLGVPREKLFLLDFEDGMLAGHKKEVEERITEIIGTYRPMEIYSPSMKDGSLDHQITSQTIRTCIQKLRLDCTVFEYSIIPKYKRIGCVMDWFTDLFKRNVVEVDIKDFLDLKEKAIKMYRSETVIISKNQKKPIIAQVARFLRSKELFRAVQQKRRKE